jgi:glycosyltransferase involved in cell wall biosynthesis
MANVSAVIITYNEAVNIRRTLGQLWWCNEIIVVDSFSTDTTVDICRQYGCKVYQRSFDGYGAQKQYAVSLAQNDWVLCIDADEVLTDKLVDEMRKEMLQPAADGYLVPMRFVFMGKEFRFGKESWRHFLRLFNKQTGNFNYRKVHEKIELNGSTKKLTNNILHYSYRDISQYFDKFNRYSSYGAEMSYEKGKKRSLALIVCAVPLNFLKYYFIELNFLNGLSGFYWSVFNAFYHFVKYIKTREMYQQQALLGEYGIPPVTTYNAINVIKTIQPI